MNAFTFGKFNHGFISLAWLMFISLLLAACQVSTYLDAVNVDTAQHLNVTAAEYRDVAWLDADTITFVYRLSGFGNSLGDFRIAVYTLSNNNLQDIPIPPKPEHCSHAPAIINHLNRLPNGNLGYIYPCSSMEAGIAGILYEWNPDTNIVAQRYYYPPPFRASSYTFLPNMSQLIQENARGPGLNNELYRVGQDGKLIQLFPNYQRVAEPSWSPNGQVMAFIGTEVYPKQTSDPKTWEQTEDLLLYPWDLFLMDLDGNDIRVLLPEVGRLYQLKWSPDGSFLAFARDPEHAEGIWILDIDTLELVRVWPENTFYDWSPDGTQMAIIAQDQEGDVTKTYPVIIDVTLPGQ